MKPNFLEILTSARWFGRERKKERKRAKERQERMSQ